MRCAHNLAVLADAVTSRTYTVHYELFKLHPIHILILSNTTPCANKYEQQEIRRLYAVILDYLPNIIPTRLHTTYKKFSTADAGANVTLNAHLC